MVAGCGRSKILIVAVVTCLACFAISPGCATRQAMNKAWILPDSLRQSAAMLLADRPFKAICLEVDCVEGAEPSDGVIDALADFLRETCDKPVSVVTGKPIPKKDVAGMPPQVIALMHMSGPAADDPNTPTAYVYALLFRGPGHWIPTGLVRYDYPCSMFIDMAATWLMAPALVRFGLKHEAGHMLSLCSNKAHGDGLHCNDSSCLMYPAISISRTFLGLQRDELCEACRRDLEEIRRSAQPTRLAFKGPFIVRQEDGYFVARLPGAVHVEAGKLDSFDWRQRLDWLRGKVREIEKSNPDAYTRLAKPNAVLKSNMWYAFETKDAYLQNRPSLLAACKDQDPTVRDIAQDFKAELDKRFALPATTNPATTGPASRPRHELETSAPSTRPVNETVR